MTLSAQDKATLKAKGISEEMLEAQLRRFATGFPYLKVQAPATPGNGILVLSEGERLRCISAWKQYLGNGGTVVKMVPASGAASRMFKALFAYADDAALNPFIEQFLGSIDKFAFYPELEQTCQRLYGLSATELIEGGRGVDVVKALINPEGMNYGQLPKALLAFHAYPEGARTPIEEHLAEGAEYAAAGGKLHVHFTVSPEHRALMQAKIDEVLPRFEQRYGLKITTDMSEQSPATDTVAVTPDGTPYREDGALFFRPAGHGALLPNLAALPEAVVFLKNIDNVVPDSRRALTTEYKQVLGGLLIDTRHRIEHYASLLRTGLPSRPVLNEILDFLRDTLFITGDEAAELDDLELADYLYGKLSRPVRVCGMVRNEGEPGGGPFLVKNPDGTISPQILESSQLNPDAPSTPALLKASTHFNPVDLACFIHDLAGHTFPLEDFVDPDTGFISSKSRQGHDIKALELPGLWNGSMSDWNTIFVEVPAETFNPVKTVNDLLRPAHQ